MSANRGRSRWALRAMAPLACALFAVHGVASASDASSADAIATAQAKVVKIYGAGGVSGLEHYQSGVLISSVGHVLTAWSYVLDADEVTVVASDGRKRTGRLVAADPRLELAVLKVDLAGAAHFDLAKPAEAEAGTRIFAISNLYNVATGDEPASVQQGWIAAETTLAARRGTYRTPYTGPIYVLDAVTNNPGAAGGAVVNLRGELLGVLGKELRDRDTNTWLNYALPVAAIREAVNDLAAGRGPQRREDEAPAPVEPHQLTALGITLVPDALPRTPPYVDRVRAESPAARAGIRPDDLVIMIGEHLAPSCRAVGQEIASIDRADPVKVTLLREQELIEVQLAAPENAVP